MSEGRQLDMRKNKQARSKGNLSLRVFCYVGSSRDRRRGCAERVFSFCGVKSDFRLESLTYLISFMTSL